MIDIFLTLILWRQTDRGHPLFFPPPSWRELLKTQNKKKTRKITTPLSTISIPSIAHYSSCAPNKSAKKEGKLLMPLNVDLCAWLVLNLLLWQRNQPAQLQKFERARLLPPPLRSSQKRPRRLPINLSPHKARLLHPIAMW